MNIDKVAIVTTTINLPTFLDRYFRNFNKYDVNPDRVVFIIVGDEKTNPDAKKYAQMYTEYPVEFWDVYDQRIWLKDTFPKMGKKILEAIPFNSVRRRNFGYLRAMEIGADITITIDDDNLPTDDVNWLESHLEPFKRRDFPLVSSANRIVNPCQLLKFENRLIYSRGYPISEIGKDSFTVAKTNEKPVCLNMGLWYNKPDVDAYTNIIYPDLISNGMYNGEADKVAIYENNYFPINTQNTAFLTKFTPIFYVLKMDSMINGLKIDRYDDIWSGWMLQKIMHKFGYTATFGTPLSYHDRNSHNYSKDLSCEFIGIALNLLIFDAIDKCNITASTISEAYLQLADAIDNVIVNNYEMKEYLSKLADSMRTWIKLTGELI